VKCPFCAHLESKVIDSRTSGVGDVTRRRRECEGCTRRFTTYERVEEVLPVLVKKDGRRETFDRQKVMNGLKKACEKRPVSLSMLEDVADRVERYLLELSEKEVASQVVGEQVMRALKTLDGIAYIRFASVYRSFQDIGELMSELERMRVDPASEALS
jgi:transcriptional repressor NrdR